MATTPNSIITPQTPYMAAVSLAAVTACATRAPTAVASLAAANIFQLVPTTTNGLYLDGINVSGCSSSISAATVAQVVQVWLNDGTTAWLFDEILVTAVTPSTTVAAFKGFAAYAVPLPSTWSVWVATTVTTTASTTALNVVARGRAL
jgi:hypothetical protein